MANQVDSKDRRLYQRVLVEPSSSSLQVVIKGYGAATVFDMSYSGAAFAQPKEKKINDMDETLVVELVTELDKASIEAKPIRVTNDVVAVQFDEITVKARLIIDRVVTDRIVGLNMALIDPKHYSGQADYSFWFHGPKETNLYFWLSSDTIEKVQLDTDNSVIIYEGDSFFFENRGEKKDHFLNNQQIALKALAIVQQMDFDLKALEEFKQILAAHVQV